MEPLGLLEPALLAIDERQVVQGGGETLRILAARILVELDRAQVESLGHLVAPGQPVGLGQIVDLGRDRGVVRAELGLRLVELALEERQRRLVAPRRHQLATLGGAAQRGVLGRCGDGDEKEACQGQDAHHRWAGPSTELRRQDSQVSPRRSSPDLRRHGSRDLPGPAICHRSGRLKPVREVGVLAISTPEGYRALDDKSVAEYLASLPAHPRAARRRAHGLAGARGRRRQPQPGLHRRRPRR